MRFIKTFILFSIISLVIAFVYYILNSIFEFSNIISLLVTCLLFTTIVSLCGTGTVANLLKLKYDGDRKGTKDKYGNVEFILKCKMKERWVPDFLALLKRMQSNGEAGHTAILAFYDDGDGDFRPTFESNVDYPYPITKTSYDWKEENGTVHKGTDIINNITEIEELFDAG